MSTHGRTIYLHFFDRELGESVRCEVKDCDAQVALKLLVLFCGAALNCSASILFESPALNSSASLNTFTQLLVKTGHISVISSHPTMVEFFESRSTLYSHDRLRYPMYFGKPVLCPDAVALIPKSTSATLTLANTLMTWGSNAQSGGDREREAKRIVQKSLVQREDRAVTAALFTSVTDDYANPHNVIGYIRRKISIEYTKHFMSSLNSDICTGIKGIAYFDECANTFPPFDIQILSALGNIIGLSRLLYSDWTAFRVFWETALETMWQLDGVAEFQHQINLMGSALSNMYLVERGNNTAAFRLEVVQALRSVAGQFSFGEIDVARDALKGADARVKAVISILSNNPAFSEALHAARAKMQSRLTIDYLLIVATEVEQQAVMEKVKSIGNTITTRLGGGRAYHDLGIVYGNRVALVKTAMGSVSVGGSTATSMLMISHLKPRYVIMVGIAFGVNEDKQPIGTVLIGRQVLGYELQRVGTDNEGNMNIIPRGPKTDTSPVLLSLLEGAAAVWNEAPVEVGLMLSGEKLVDNLDFREQLKTVTGGEAIGGEMEATGLAVAAAEKPTHWILVKSVCDWADGNKSTEKKARQLLAAQNAVSLVFRAFQVEPDDEGR